MLALTIWQPFASLIVGSPGSPPQKPVENRSWRPPAALVGKQIAIHAGKKLDRETLDLYEDIFEDKAFGPVIAPYATPKLFPLGAVVGVATLDRVIALQYKRESHIDQDRRFATIPRDTIASWGLGEDGLRWFFGPFGWMFRDRQRLAEPVQCGGAQGLWTLTPDVEHAVTEQLAKVRR